MMNIFRFIRANQAHEQYHEALRRAQQPQAVMKHRKPKSLLLPAPNNIIFEMFNTIIMEIPSERLMDFITKNLRDYLLAHWSSKILQQMIRRLKREQAIDVRAGLTSVPVIKFSTGAQTSRSPTTIVDVRKLYLGSAQSPQSPNDRGSLAAVPATASPTAAAKSAPDNQLTPITSRTSIQPPRPTIRSGIGPANSGGVAQVAIKEPVQGTDPKATAAATRRQTIVAQVYDHIMWRIQTDNVTQAASLLIKFALDDGYKKGKLKSEPYEDVGPCFEDWRGQKLIKLYAFGAAPANDQKLVLASSTAGDLTKWIANYIDGAEKRHKPELIRILAATLRDKTKNCIFITNELIDAIRSLDSGAIRCVLLVDRLNRYEPITSMPNFSTQIEPLIQKGKLFIMSTLACVDFAPDPSSENCC